MGCPHSGHLRGIPASVRARSAQQKGQTKTSPPSNMVYWIAGGDGVASCRFMVSEQGQVLPEGDPPILTGGVALLPIFGPAVAQDRTVRHFAVLSVAVVAELRSTPGFRFEMWTGTDSRVDARFRSWPVTLADCAGCFIEAQERTAVKLSVALWNRLPFLP